MKKKILITRKLLRSNEERATKLWDVKLNLNDEIYSQKKLLELSQGCDGILSSLTDKIDKNVVIAAHGNSIRALCKYLFKINENDISKLEIPTGNPLLIEFEKGIVKNARYLDKDRAQDLIKF